MSTVVSTYELDDGTTVAIEHEPTSGFRPAGPDHVVADLRKALRPAISAAHEVLEQVRSIAPDEVAVQFGVKAGGESNFLVAKAAGEANFSITLTWKSPQAPE